VKSFLNFTGLLHRALAREVFFQLHRATSSGSFQLSLAREVIALPLHRAAFRLCLVLLNSQRSSINLLLGQSGATTGQPSPCGVAAITPWGETLNYKGHTPYRTQ
jgi:hypothetical protein